MQSPYSDHVSTVIVPRSKAEIDRDIAAIRKTTKEITRSRKTARAWLIKHGFITKSGRWTKRYGG
jgi:predicted ATP-dependent serine protease